MLDKLMNNVLPKKIANNVPNIITIIRILSSIGITAAICITGLTAPLLIGSLTIITALTDTLDGYIARKYNCQSKIGASLDAFADKILNWGIGGSLLVLGIMPSWVLSILVRDIYVGVNTIKYKIKSGEQIRKINSEYFSNDKLNEFSKNMRMGNNISPTIYGKLKMWAQSVGVCASILFCNIPTLSLVAPISFLTAIGLCSADIIKFNKILKEKYNELEKNEKKFKEQTLKQDCNNLIFQKKNIKNKTNKFTKEYKINYLKETKKELLNNYDTKEKIKKFKKEKVYDGRNNNNK